MANLRKLIDLELLQFFLGQIKTKFVRSVNNGKPDVNGNVNIATMTGASASAAGTAGLTPIPKAGQQDMALCGGAEYKLLPISGGGTGANNAAAARTNLGIDTTYFNPTGTIIAFAGNTLPDGYLLCDGSQVSRTTYKKLFDVIGTTYGEGDGSTTFTLPNLIDRFLEGSSAAGKYREAGLPNIEGSLGIRNYSVTGGNLIWAISGAFSDNPYGGTVSDNAVASGQSTKGYDGLTFNASKSNSIYGASSTVQPKALTTQYLIKY